MTTMDELRARTDALATWTKAREALSKFCHGRGTMCVPIQPDDDDLVIGAMLDRGKRLDDERAALLAVAQAAKLLMMRDYRLDPRADRLRNLLAELPEPLRSEVFAPWLTERERLQRGEGGPT